MTDGDEVVVNTSFSVEVASLFTSKIRIQLLNKLLLNPAMEVYLRGVEREMGVNSNTARIELNKLADLNLIQVVKEAEPAKIKKYQINTQHPMFSGLRALVLKHVGIDQIIDNVINQLGDVDRVLLTGDSAAGKDAAIIDLIIVGAIDKSYLQTLIEKVERTIQKKIRVAVYAPAEFSDDILNSVTNWVDLL